MRRADLEHVIRAAAAVANDDEIVVIGSQAVLGQLPDAPEALLWSQEADVYPRSHPERAKAIDGALGDGSQFHAAFGYYAHGVGPETAKAPAGWCLEAHDVVLAKCAAGRERDWEFAREAVRHGVVDPDELLRRAGDLPLPASRREQVAQLLRGIVAASR